MDEDVIFVEPRPYSQKEILQIMTDGDCSKISFMLLGVAYYEENPIKAMAIFKRYCDHADPGIRQVVMTNLGHYARVHEDIPVEPAAEMIKRALQDDGKYVAGNAEHVALADIEIYCPHVYPKIMKLIEKEYKEYKLRVPD